MRACVQRLRKEQKYMSLSGDERVTLLPSIYHVNLIVYESALLALTTIFLGRYCARACIYRWHLYMVSLPG